MSGCDLGAYVRQRLRLIPDRLRHLVRKFDPVERDYRNRTLGKAGERFVLDLDRRRLTQAGRVDLAERVRWVAAETSQSVPLVADASALQVSPEELKAAILLFYSLLDEQQRRLFAGLESIKLGHGGDSVLAEFLGLDPHTVARGRPPATAPAGGRS